MAMHSFCFSINCSDGELMVELEIELPFQIQKEMEVYLPMPEGYECFDLVAETVFADLTPVPKLCVILLDKFTDNSPDWLAYTKAEALELLRPIGYTGG